VRSSTLAGHVAVAVAVKVHDQVHVHDQVNAETGDYECETCPKPRIEDEFGQAAELLQHSAERLLYRVMTHRMRSVLASWLYVCLVSACAADSEPPPPADSVRMNPTPMAGNGQAGAAAAIDHSRDLRGLCNLQTSFPDDRACIPAPPPGEGMQIHVGPKNYVDPAEVAKYILRPGEETSECFIVHAPNDDAVYYQTSVLSGRAGTHHIINTMFPRDETTTACDPDGLTSPRAIGNFPGASKPYMPRATVPPEYAHVGRTIPARAQMQADMHYFNHTDKEIVREFWLNIYFTPKEKITAVSKGIAALGGLGWNAAPIAPGTDKVYSYNCPVKGDGHILSLLGHYHAHGERFTASVARKSGAVEKVFEMYDYVEPAEFPYNSVITNPMFSASQAGAVSGRLAVHDGDVLQWECHIVNDSQVGLTYTNQVDAGEMCNLWGNSIGVEPIVCFLP
jgi:hypothetical protein